MTVEEARSIIGQDCTETDTPLRDSFAYETHEAPRMPPSTPRPYQNLYQNPQSLMQFASDRTEEYWCGSEQPAAGGLRSSVVSQKAHAEDFETQPLDLFQPLFDPDMLELFSNRVMPDLSQFDTASLNLNYLDIEGWDKTTVDVATRAPGIATCENISALDWDISA
ncbi:uncharacterized protein A1O5_02154 [Cladophialophora psammophila CBS 110553]|uniref:Uncharacterized protein n=1 Tax=Cladophialophora psammophila CBS 110553 TaxID=1182543 RepID=W9X5I4_9EURO|nr:uncharacterized protein A1O5_02154 [Cladophialophora psammophila CBS 110553]EXJ75458.1 hypothetical protein A1O5_02154 [Cladophialophora psammophila CBS 110553]